ncbi:glucose 1-dehydrogenase [Nakamurella leprariae]|uniref:Glucose 1-dehydrogenase n=1 Tax=Nakamurella leprariae TaxID=2803911 RepID=A0A938YI62_9ACTN|nr:glucose 1-dehydrogenase [Nakamurella leprariae]MBM9468245.1 glucose 1-dehydrogenase [Nakamurella leprariae]
MTDQRIDQYTRQDPTTLYADRKPDEQYLEGAGTDAEMAQNVPADHGEDSYRGSGRLEGRKALITGGDSGIGAAVAIAFAREGADVAISYLPEEEQDARRIVGLIEAAGRTAVVLPGDITSQPWCEELVAKAVEGLGGLDILVNNAGKQQNVDAITDLEDDEFDATFRTNVYATFWITKAAVPHLVPGSAIINTTSIQAYAPSPNLVHYAATKATVNNLAKGLAAQLAPKGIRVNAVAPGSIWTPLQPAGGQKPEDLPTTGEQTYLGRWGQPAELAPAYVFLASGESSYVVGATIHVDGGVLTP